MYRRWLAIPHVRSRTKRKFFVATIWALLVITGFEYYFYKSTQSHQHSQSFVVEVDATGKDGVSTVLDKNKATEPRQSQTKEPKFQATTQKSEDVEAEKDSNVRRQAVEKVCEKRNDSSVFEQYDPRNRKKRLQRFNVLHHLIVNEAHKVLFCFMPKVGCTNMKRIFLVMDGLYPSVEKVNHKYMNQEIRRLDSKKFTEEQRRYMLKNFYKFMIVRDPFERIVSAYRNKWLDKRNTQLHGSLGKRIVEKYRYDNKQTVKTGDDVKFIEYARYLIDTAPEEVNEHWMPYKDLCRPCDVNYNFIGSIDTLFRDVTHAIRQIHANETKYHMVQSYKGALTNTRKSAASFLKELPRTIFDRLLAVYKSDHELFGYPLPNYDSLDKRYSAK